MTILSQMDDLAAKEFLLWIGQQPESLRVQSEAIQIGAWRGERHRALMATIRRIAHRGQSYGPRRSDPRPTSRPAPITENDLTGGYTER